jgi:hypothetical protein
MSMPGVLRGTGECGYNGLIKDLSRINAAQENIDECRRRVHSGPGSKVSSRDAHCVAK